MMVRLVPVLLAALAAAPAAAFSPQAVGAARSRSSTQLFVDNTKTPPSLDISSIKDISYGEESRQYRRTVFSHDDWVKFRSTDRFFYYIASFTSSGIYKSVAREVLTTTAIATFVVIFNCIVGGYSDFEGVTHDALVSSQWLPLLGLPLAPFTLSSPSLGLLLGQWIHHSEF